MTIDTVELSCSVCHVSSWVTQQFADYRRRHTAKVFYCPNGHPQVFTKPKLEKPAKVKR